MKKYFFVLLLIALLISCDNVTEPTLAKEGVSLESKTIAVGEIVSFGWHEGSEILLEFVEYENGIIIVIADGEVQDFTVRKIMGVLYANFVVKYRLIAFSESEIQVRVHEITPYLTN